LNVSFIPETQIHVRGGCEDDNGVFEKDGTLPADAMLSALVKSWMERAQVQCHWTRSQRLY
jgi:hypothetical protein